MCVILFIRVCVLYVSLCTFLFVMNTIGHYEIGKICAAMLVVAEHQEQTDGILSAWRLQAFFIIRTT